MIRNVTAQDAQALAHICKTALKHETDAVTIGQRIRELSLNDFYYIAVYEKMIMTIGFWDLSRRKDTTCCMRETDGTSLPLRLIRRLRGRVLERNC